MGSSATMKKHRWKRAKSEGNGTISVQHITTHPSAFLVPALRQGECVLSEINVANSGDGGGVRWYHLFLLRQEHHVEKKIERERENNAR